MTFWQNHNVLRVVHKTRMDQGVFTMKTRQVIRPYRPLSGLAAFVSAFFVLTLVVYVAVSVVVGAALGDATHRRPIWQFVLLESSGLVAAVCSFMVIWVVCGTIKWIAYLVWVYRSYSNLPALGRASLSYDSPGWAVGDYFIPIISLFRPYQVMRETWAATRFPLNTSSAKQGPRSCWLLRLWWFFWLVEFFGFGVLYQVHSSQSPWPEPMVIWIEVLYFVTYLTSTMLTILVVRRISKSQEQTHLYLARAQARARATVAHPTLPRQGEANIFADVLDVPPEAPIPVAEVVAEPPDVTDVPSAGASAPRLAPAPVSRCPICATPYDGGERFCASCGAALPRTCRRCHTQLKPNAAYCTQCGASAGPA
jgi:hypothetical protein